MKAKQILITVMFMAMVFCAVESHARTYRFAWIPWIGFSPLHVADTKGFWKEQGLDVKIVKCTDGQDMVSLFKDKRVDVMVDMIGSGVGLYLEGVHLTILMETDWSHGGDKILMRKDVNPSDLKGKNVGIYQNSFAVTYFLNRWLSTAGLKLSDVKPVEMEVKPMTDSFINGMFDLMVCYDPEAIRAEKEGKGKVVATSASYEGCIPEGIMVMKDILSGIPKEDIAKILKGWIKGVKWLHDQANHREYMEIINTRIFADEGPYSEKEIQEICSNVRIHDPQNIMERNRDGGGLYSYLTDLKMFLTENSMPAKDFAPKDIFDNYVILEVLNAEP